MNKPAPSPYQHPPRPAATQQRLRGQEARAEVTIICEARQGIRPWARVRLEDLSPQGFRIAWFKEADMTQVLRIKIPGLEMLAADVRWRRGDWLGCRFSSPLHEAVFAHIVAQAIA
ncbi:MAG: PilZ domain-containing protein [Proteobacteria bacterium]|nr:PilZ domain-containing protein [Pseudomonadota bacterium]